MRFSTYIKLFEFKHCLRKDIKKSPFKETHLDITIFLFNTYLANRQKEPFIVYYTKTKSFHFLNIDDMRMFLHSALAYTKKLRDKI